MSADQQLVGVRVLDLGIWRPAPYAAQLLAELGATVTKIEPPGGDPMRVFTSLYRTLNHRKQIIEIDLKSDAGRAELVSLLASCDVVLEGFRPGVAARLGVDATAALAANPRVIHCSISGFGQVGPLADASGHDINYQAWAGTLGGAGTGGVETAGASSALPVADLAGGAFAALSICAALTRRGLVGADRYEGERIDVSMADVLVTWAAPESGGELTSGDGASGNFPGYGTFACADGSVSLGIVTEDPFWRSLCRALALDDVADLDVTSRAAQGAALRARLATTIVTRGRDELVAVLLSEGVPVAPVLSRAEAIALEHFAARGTVADGVIAHPVRYG